MTAAELMLLATGQGLQLSPNGNKLDVRGNPAALDKLREDLIAHKPEIMAILQERELVPTATEAVLSAAALLRQGKWAPEAAPCAFFIGTSIEPNCRRCGGTWQQHTAGTPAEQDA